MLGGRRAFSRQACFWFVLRGLAWPSSMHSSHSMHSDCGREEETLSQGGGAVADRMWWTHGSSLWVHSSSSAPCCFWVSRSWIATSPLLPTPSQSSRAHKAKAAHFGVFLAVLWVNVGQGCQEWKPGDAKKWGVSTLSKVSALLGRACFKWKSLDPIPLFCVWPHGSESGPWDAAVAAVNQQGSPITKDMSWGG